MGYWGGGGLYCLKDHNRRIYNALWSIHIYYSFPKVYLYLTLHYIISDSLKYKLYIYILYLISYNLLLSYSLLFIELFHWPSLVLYYIS